MNVLVVGGSQFNGYYLVSELVRCGHDLWVLNRGQTAANFPPGINRLTADRTQIDTMRAALDGLEFDCVYDLCAYHPEDTEMMVELLAGRVKHYVFASSTVIYAAADVLPITEEYPLETGEAQIEYGAHKILCEDVLMEAHRSSGFPATSVAFSMVFGPRNIIPDREQRMITRILTGRPVLIFGDGTTLLQVGHVGDQAVALEAMLGQPQTFGQRYNLTNSKCVTDEAYVDAFGKVLGREVNKVFIPAELMDGLWDGTMELTDPAGTGSGAGSSSTASTITGGGGAISNAYIDIRSSDAARRERAKVAVRFKLAQINQRLAPNIHRWNHSTVFGINKLRRDVGFEPRVGLEEMIAEVYDWMRSENINPQFDWTTEDQILELVRQHG